MKAIFYIGLLLSSLIASSNVIAQVNFIQERQFYVDKACEAYTSFKKQTGSIALIKDSHYTALGLNKFPDSTHVYAQLGDQKKWIPLSCGYFKDGETTPSHINAASNSATSYTTANKPPSQATPPSKPGTEHCLPFFDDIDNPVAIKVGGKIDITPPAPDIEPFGHAVNQVCGQAGKVVSREEFKEMMRENAQVLARLQAFTQNKVFDDRPAKTDPEAYLEDLSDAWFNLKAFDHIMCGEPKAGGKIGGLHFHGRYLQLQETGEACRLANHKRNEVVPGVIYSMGVRMNSLNGGTAKSSIKGYGLTLSAEDILKTVTKAMADNPTPEDKSKACLLPISDEEHSFISVFVRRSTGIRTFYPDASPNPRDPTCRIPIRL